MTFDVVDSLGSSIEAPRGFLSIVRLKNTTIADDHRHEIGDENELEEEEVPILDVAREVIEPDDLRSIMNISRGSGGACERDYQLARLLQPTFIADS